MLRWAAALALCAGAAHATLSGPEITLQGGVFRVRPAPPGATLQVFVDGTAPLPPLLGAMMRQGDTLTFEPRFELERGLRYRAEYSEPRLVAPLTQVFSIAAAPAWPATVLERIDPSPDVLPENLLKLYLNFSAPMSRGEAYRRVRLLDEAGRKVELPFLEIDQELWDRETRRLTLLFDPGRVKRDLLPHDEVGTPLREGLRYTLVIDREWPDAHGNPLARETRKSFRVGAADHDPPKTSSWRLAPPKPGTRDPLSVTFPEPLDRALLERVVAVFAASGTAVAGDAAIDSNQTRWLFTPREAWKAGDYALRAETILEDLAGNSLGRPFEVDVFERIEDRALNVSETVRFRIE